MICTQWDVARNHICTAQSLESENKVHINIPNSLLSAATVRRARYPYRPFAEVTIYADKLLGWKPGWVPQASLLTHLLITSWICFPQEAWEWTNTVKMSTLTDQSQVWYKERALETVLINQSAFSRIRRVREATCWMAPLNLTHDEISQEGWFNRKSLLNAQADSQTQHSLGLSTGISSLLVFFSRRGEETQRPTHRAVHDMQQYFWKPS